MTRHSQWIAAATAAAAAAPGVMAEPTVVER
eukprot:CAMPEP_0183728480 /NCGR_PEP_ID=MMETSP0737-20130205/28169_1 /TAXON_ID=385413 /ORGANISM="Thalassiosira miniscula, Strain CCMP1093" /LENGTH=30 /DNA_ID= /DNA_START= /DNA_END= /DNA_ORIENTATION=